MLSCFSNVWLCDLDCCPPGSSVCGVLQARILEWVAISSSRGSSRPRGRTQISYVFPALTGGFFTTSTTWEACRLSCLPQILFPLSYPLTHTHTHTHTHTAHANTFLIPSVCKKSRCSNLIKVLNEIKSLYKICWFKRT